MLVSICLLSIDCISDRAQCAITACLARRSPLLSTASLAGARLAHCSSPLRVDEIISLIDCSIDIHVDESVALVVSVVRLVGAR